MAEFKTALAKTLLHEGKYSNDQKDLGAETYKGISRKFHPKWKGWQIIDNYKKQADFPASLEKDIELQIEVEQFYITTFWKPIQADYIHNQAIVNSVFDFAVNAGITKSILLSQSILECKIDGIVGVNTLHKINTINPELFLTTFTLSKVTHYIKSVKRRPTNKIYLYGWICRALEYKD